MSRVGKRPIKLPSGVKVKIDGGRVLVEGPRGKLTTTMPRGIVAELADSALHAKRTAETKEQRALHGLSRTLLSNAVKGVSKGFTRELDVVGIGYKAEMRGRYLNLSLGFSHPVEFPVPEGIEIKVERAQRTISNYAATVIVSGNDKSQVGQVAADLRRLRPPDPYKGKGVRYAEETVRLKVGKKGA